MVLCVTLATLSFFEANPILEALRLRKRVLIDQHQWANITVQPCHYGGFEYDEFDTPSTYYLIKMAENGSAIATGRINPTTRPYMLSETFRKLCDAQPAHSPDVVEGSRIVVDKKQVGAEHMRSVVNEIIMAYLQCSMYMGAKCMVAFMLPKVWKSTFGNAGWAYHWTGDAHKLEHSNEIMRAAELPISPDIYVNVVRETGLQGNILDFGNNPHCAYPGCPTLSRYEEIELSRV